MVRVKNGTSLDNVHPKIFLAIAFAAVIWEGYGVDLWVTGANEAGHSTGPRGYHRLPDGTCQAVDLRTWNLPTKDRPEAVERLGSVLGPLYDVLYERPGEKGEHAHVQWDPTRPGTKVVS